MTLPSNLKYTAAHEWVRTEEDGVLAIGVTQHGQELLGDMVFAEMPQAGRAIKAGEACCVLESVKAAADVHAPVNGVVVAHNEELDLAPEKINADPYGAWIFKMRPDNAADVNALFDAAAYQAAVDSEAN